MVESQQLRRSGRQNNADRPNYQESDSDEYESDDVYEFNDYYIDNNDSDSDFDDRSRPASCTNTTRRTATSRATFLSAARDSTLPVHQVSIPDIVQLNPIQHSVPDVITRDDVDYNNPVSIFMMLFDESIQKLYDATEPRYKQMIVDRIHSTSNQNKNIVYSPLTVKDMKAFIGQFF